MANLSGVQLDPHVKESTGEFVVLPAGKYQAVITGDELKSTSTGGTMLVLSLVVTEGPHAGTALTDRLNIINNSAKAQAIGQGKLKRICALTGVNYPPPDTTPTYGKPLTITVKVEPFKSNTDGRMLESNKVSAYGPAEKGGGLVASAPAPAPDASFNPSAAW